MKLAVLGVTFLVLCTACGGGGDGGDADGSGMLPVLAAGAVGLVPATDDSWKSEVDLARLSVDRVEQVYDLTTPAAEPFVFDVLCRADGNRGAARVSIAHALDEGAVPGGGPESLAPAGLVLSGAGRVQRDAWLDAHGDGFARLTVRGEITGDQILAVQAGTGSAAQTVLVRLRIGPRSEVNLAAERGGDYPGVLDEQTIYSSDSWMFGLPTAAVSGDRTSIVCYEGDRGDPQAYVRYEMRLQVDHASGDVTGGAADEASPDSGNWRDHEIAGLYNVLALAHSGTDAVSCRLSFDRGATFGQVVEFRGTAAGYRPRLVQIAMAADYSLALLYWRGSPTGATELVLAEGRPDVFDGTGTPTHFAFDPETVVRAESGDVMPMLMGVTWSEGGDLVVGYAFTRFESLPDRTWSILTQNRCLVRPWGGVLRDTLVEEDLTVGRDPSVSVLGSGETLRIFYAYEARDGVRLRASDDAGRSWSAPLPVGDPSSHLPTVFARDRGAELLVEVLHLTQAPEGLELHLTRWPDFPAATSVEYRLTQARFEPTVPTGSLARAPLVEGGPVPPPEGGFRVTQVAWFGYDAVIDGDDLVVVYDEETFDSWYMLDDLRMLGGTEGLPAGADSGFGAVDPPPLLPGLTEPAPLPDPLDMHQLRVIRLD